MRSPVTIFKNTLYAFVRKARAKSRPTKAANLQRLRHRGETLDSIYFRNLTIDDVAELAQIHVMTWNETYSPGGNGPSVQLRENQWRDKFNKKDESWFAIGVENIREEMIGFAVGKRYTHNEEYKGELDKIYLLQTYQRMGIGTKLLKECVRRFRQMGINSIVLFGIPQNPSCYFHEAMGGERLYSKKGEFHAGYGWKDISIILDINE